MSLLWKILVLAVVVAAGIAVVVKMESGEKPLAAPDPVERARYLGAIAPPDANEPIWSQREPATSDTTAAAVPDVQSNEHIPAPTPTATKVRPYEVPPVRSMLATPGGAPSARAEAIPSESQGEGEPAGAPKVVGSKPGMEAESHQVDQMLLLPETTVPSESNTEGQVTGMAERPAAASTAPAAPLAVHRVGRGDSLYKLAGTYYGDANRWKLILDANPALQGGVREMRVGTELVIPALPQANP